MQHGLRIRKHDVTAIHVTEVAVEQQIHCKASIRAPHLANQLEMPLVLRDRRVDSLTPSPSETPNEVAPVGDRDVPVQVLAFQHEVPLRRNHEEVNLRGQATMLEKQILQHVHLLMRIAQLIEDALLTNDAGFYRANV